jgi:Spy/CpxP family protein refolding chaperone
MKKLMALTLAGTMLLGGSMVYAGGACCPSKANKAAKTEKAVNCGDETFSKLNLSDEQKKKVEALRAECKKDGCTASMHEKFTKSMKEILTADQYTQWESECQKVSKGSCPMKKDEPKS